MIDNVRKIDQELLEGLTEDEIDTWTSFLTDCRDPSSERPTNGVIADLSMEYEQLFTTEFEVNKRFSHLNFFAKGGFNRIFTAYDTESEENVLIKVPNEDSDALKIFLTFDRYQEEYNLLRTLHDLGINEVPKPVILDATWIGPNQLCCNYLVTNFVEGRSLFDLIYVEDFGFNKINELFIKICEVMNKVHENNIIHRDLKPENIIVDNENQIRIIDWETAINLNTLKTSKAPDEYLGTLGYCAPEKVNGQNHSHSKLDDIYALGAILAVMLAKQKMFFKLDAEEIIELHKNYITPPLLTNISEYISDERVVNVIKKAMHVEAGKRYQDIGDLLDDLKVVN